MDILGRQAAAGVALAEHTAQVVAGVDAPRARRDIWTWWVDFLCVGGLVVVPFAVIYALDVPFSQFRHWNSLVLVSQVLFNYPHFMASYRLLYQSRAMIQRYRWASIYLPMVLVSYILFCLIHPLVFGDPINLRYWHFADLISTSYLAVHYTGQAWGMVASFSYLGSAPLTTPERLAIRGTLYIFMVWHIAIANVVAPEYSIFFPGIGDFLKWTLSTTTVLAHAGMATVVVAFVWVACRIRRVPPLAMIVPVPVLYFGYLILTRGREGILLLQFAHALQYLIFPLRVEMNRSDVSSPRQRLFHLIVYVVGIVVVGNLVFVGTSSIPSRPVMFAAVLLAAMVNIHHFYIDGCVWKISTPEVRKDLFKHLAPGTMTRPPAGLPSGRLPGNSRGVPAGT
jgi:hypothetical protein